MAEAEKKKRGFLSDVLSKADRKLEEKAKEDCGCGCCPGSEKNPKQKAGKDRDKSCC